MTTIAAVRDLQVVRGEIDEIDRSLVGLMATRLDLARQARVLKHRGELAVADPAREGTVVRQAAEVARDFGLDPEIVRDVFWRLISLSQWPHSEDSGVEPG